MQFTISEIPNVAKEILARASAERSPSHASLVTFSGDLGAGKTTLIQEIARQLGITETLQSPTFVIYKRYEIKNNTPQTLHSLRSDRFSFRTRIASRGGGSDTWKFLIHGDMYRLESADEIKKLGWDDLLSNPENLVVIEWPERIVGTIPDWAFKLRLKHAENEEVRYLDFI